MPPPEAIPHKSLKIGNRAHKITLFSRQFASMTSSGLPLIQALDVCAEQEVDPNFRYALESVGRRMSSGYTFSKSLSEFPKIFPAIFPHLARAGENTGKLQVILTRLADMLESEEVMLKKVKGALSYPLFILGLTFVLTLVIFSTVLPSFADFYAEMELDLPLITSTLMGVTAVVSQPWFWVLTLLVVGTAIHLLRRAWEKPDGRLILFNLIQAIPMLGKIVESSCLARYAWVLQITLDSGLGIMKSLQLASLASGSEILVRDSRRLIDGITAGDRITELMQMRPDLYPGFLNQMVMLGEETSRMAQSCGYAALWYQDDVESRVETFHAALEPMLMAVVSFIVGGIVVSVFLPLYGLLEKLG